MNPVKEEDPDPIPDYCDLSREEMARRTPPTIEMMERATGIEDEPDGYTFLFPGDPKTLQLVLAFAAEERRCCPMGTYTIRFQGEQDPIRFTFTGPDGMKADIRNGMQLERWFAEVP